MLTVEAILDIALDHCTHEHALDMQMAFKEAGEKASRTKIATALYEYAMDQAPADFDKMTEKDQKKVRKVIKALARSYFF